MNKKEFSSFIKIMEKENNCIYENKIILHKAEKHTKIITLLDENYNKNVIIEYEKDCYFESYNLKKVIVL